ncbi:MAG: hypothetical protein AAF849_00490 [Bacteroidota bacterium]
MIHYLPNISRFKINFYNLKNSFNILKSRLKIRRGLSSNLEKSKPKECMLLLLWMGMSCWSSSQSISLQPILQSNESDTFFCFDVQQAKSLAQTLEDHAFQRQINEVLDSENEYLYQNLKEQKKLIGKLDYQLENCHEANLTYEANLQRLRKEKGKLKSNQKWQTSLLGIAVGVLGLWSILN